MSIKIKIKGLKKAQRLLEEIAKGLEYPELQKWVSKIENESKNACSNQYKDSIKLSIEKVTPKKFNLTINADEKALPYIKRAIQSNLRDMPLTTRGFFAKALENI